MSDWIVFLAIAFGTFAIISYYVYREEKKRGQEMIEATTKRTESLGEKVLGYIRVMSKKRLSISKWITIHEVLVITPNKVFVNRVLVERTELADRAAERTYSSHSFAIPKSEITKVELTKTKFLSFSELRETKFLPLRRKIKLNIITSKKEYKWYAQGLIPEKKDVKLEDYENILRLAFPEKLTVKK